MRRVMFFVVVTAVVGMIMLDAAYGASSRIKDISGVKGVQDVPMDGIGLVTGLNGTGDKTLVTSGAVKKYLQSRSQTYDQKLISTKNVAIVRLSAVMPAFAREGATVEVKISCLGDATSLEGGELVPSPLYVGYGAGAKVVAMASGKISTNSEGLAGVSLVTGTIAPSASQGAKIMSPLKIEFIKDNKIEIILNDPDFSTAQDVASTINLFLRTSPDYSSYLVAEKDGKTAGLADALDGGRISVPLPAAADKGGEPPEIKVNPVKFISEIQQLTVDVDKPARIVINEKTGSVVINENVVIDKAVVSTTDSVISIGGAKLDQVVAMLKKMNVSSKEISGILQKLRAAGALRAEIVLE